MDQGILRIIDANLNRAREGLRVVEEITRFILDDEVLTRKVKALRHQLRQGAVGVGVSPVALVLARDSDHDVGAGFSLASENARDGGIDLAVANLKRVQEAARSLEEFSKILGGEGAGIFKGVRFAAYTLEKDLWLRLKDTDHQGEGKMKDFELYVITGDKFSLSRPIPEVVRAAIDGGAQVIQLREKELSVRELIVIGKELRAITREKGVTFIVNDRVDVALAVDADGVHLGQDDLPVEVARRILGPGKIVGVSTHSLDQAIKAQADGADYIGVGPVFATQSKEDVCAPVGLEYVREASREITIPFVAIGGIKAHNVHEVIMAGADRIAVITEVVGAPDIAGAARKLREEIARAKARREEG